MTTEKIYFIGFIKAGKTLIVQMRKDKDFLSCQLWQYFGERITTKARIKEQKAALLIEVNKTYNKEFKHIKID